MGTLFVDKLDPQSGTSLEIGSSGDTITIPSGATITNNGTQTGFGGANTPAFEATLSSDQDIGDSVNTKIQFNTEQFDTDNAYDNSSNYRFTPQTSGKYFVFTMCVGFTTAGGYTDLAYMSPQIYKNGSRIAHAIFDLGSRQRQVSPFISTVVDMNGSSDYLEVYCEINANSGNGKLRSGSDKSRFGSYKIIT